MKLQIITLLFFTFFTTIIYGQTEKGGIYIGGNSNFGLSSQNASDYSNEDLYIENSINSFQLSIKAGYLIIDNLVVGIGYSLNSSKEITETEFKNQYVIEITENTEEKKTNSAMVFVKYYFLKTNFKPYLTSSFGFGKIKETISNTETDYFFLSDGSIGVSGLSRFNTGGEYPTNTLTFGAGIAYFLTNYLNIELEVNYTNMTVKSAENTVFKGASMSLGLSLFL